MWDQLAQEEVEAVDLEAVVERAIGPFRIPPMESGVVMEDVGKGTPLNRLCNSPTVDNFFGKQPSKWVLEQSSYLHYL